VGSRVPPQLHRLPAAQDSGESAGPCARVLGLPGTQVKVEFSFDPVQGLESTTPGGAEADVETPLTRAYDRIRATSKRLREVVQEHAVAYVDIQGRRLHPVFAADGIPHFTVSSAVSVRQPRRGCTRPKGAAAEAALVPQEIGAYGN
jgi:hypothetical protein